MIKIWICKTICLFLFPFIFNSCNFAVYMLWFILSPILFNVFLNDLFLFIKKAELANFPDHSALYVGNKDLTKLLKPLQNECEIVIESFKNNELLLILTISSRRLSVPKKLIWKSALKINVLPQLHQLVYKSNFYEHVFNLCTKVNRNLNLIGRLWSYMNQKGGGTILNSFLYWNLTYGSLLWHDI